MKRLFLTTALAIGVASSAGAEDRKTVTTTMVFQRPDWPTLRIITEHMMNSLPSLTCAKFNADAWSGATIRNQEKAGWVFVSKSCEPMNPEVRP